MTIKPVIKTLFDSYPKTAQKKLYQIRNTIIDIAREDGLGPITESLKWGEASYACPQGSPVRIDWKEKSPQSVSIYFNCKTSLVETFRTLMGDRLDFIGNRELQLTLDKPLPLEEIKLCLTLAMRYHRIKHLPLLDM